MELDLRKIGRLSVKHAQEITRLEPLVRNEYNDFIGELIRLNTIKELVWLTRVTCRNTYISMIHDRMCRLALLESLLQSETSLKCIIVDDHAIGEAVSQMLVRYGSDARVDVHCISRAHRFQLLLNLIKSLYFSLNLWFWPKVLSGRPNPKEPIIYLDNFLLVDNFDATGRLKDRYYPGLIENLPSEDQKKAWYVPTLHGFRYPKELIRMFRQVANSETPILLKEDYLYAFDYLQAILLSVILPGKISQIPRWRSINISAIVKDEINLDRGSFALVSAILGFLSFKRFRQKGLNILKVVDWFENQIVDRALNLGVKKYYPDVPTKGCLGFVVSGYYAGLSPTQFELEGGSLPNAIDVIGGDMYIQERRKFCPELPFSAAPAFRFQETMKFKQNPDAEKNIVLLALPILIDESREILQLALDTKAEEGTRWVIKHHPAYKRDQFISLLPESKNKIFELSDKPLADLFQNTRLLVTTASSTCLEAVVSGIPVSILGSRSGPTLNPLEGIVDEKYWSVCYTCEHLQEALAHKPPNQPLNVSDYLMDVTPKTVHQFMEFNQ